MAPKYPVVDPAPSMDTVTANFGISEYITWVGLTGTSVVIGFAVGKPFRGPSAFTFGLTGFLAGYFLASQRSWGRLTGYLPNDREVASHGIKPPVGVTAFSQSKQR